MQRKFITNLLFLLLLNLLIKPFWILGIDRSVQNLVGSESYGFYFAIFNFSYLFSILLDVGITNFNNRNIAQNQQLFTTHFSSIIILKMMLIAVYGFVIFIVGFTIGYNSSQFYMLCWIGINQVLLSFILYLRSNISGLLLLKTDSILSVLDRFLMLIICSVLIWGHLFNAPFKIEWFVYAQTVAYLITAGIALLIVLNKSQIKRLNWNRALFIMILKQSFPYALLVFFMSLYNRLDSVMIERMLPGSTGDIQAGIYAQAFRLFDAGNNFALLFGVLLLPIFSKMIKLNESVKRMVKLSFTLIFTVAIIAALSSYFYDLELMKLMYYQQESESLSAYNIRMMESAQILGILMFSFIAVCSTYIFGTLLTANGNIIQLVKIAALGFAINVILNLTLIPVIEALGSAYASLGAQSVTAILLVILAKKHFRLKLNYLFLSKIISFAILVFLIGYFVKQIEWSWMNNLSLTIGLSLLLANILGLFNLRSIIGMIKASS
ncbi:MAG: oligosaccharide flippase family protein [Bacteroidetes bacterium]|nr:oligosaccharide flippase family protein [Bacteroidota bacterium]